MSVAPYVDSHAHLADPAFDSDRQEAIARARAAGAVAVICIGESPDAADRARDLAASAPGFLWHTAGIHPHDAGSSDLRRDLPRLRDHLESGAVAVGECGLDYFYDNAPRAAQRRIFDAQLELAHETGRPLVVHSREAVDDTRAVVRAAGDGGVRGVLHCFTGPRELAEHALEAGWYVSFSGIVTFRKWTDDELLRAIPDDRVLVESDAPYLAPVPHRGHRNEPAFVAMTLERVAAARGVSADALGRIVTANAAALFGVAIAPSHS